MSSYNQFITDYNNMNLTAHDVRRLNRLNSKQYCKLRNLAINNKDIPAVRHMNHTGAKFYFKNKNGEYQVQKTINGKKTIIGRFTDEETAKKVVQECIEHNWEINKIQDIIDLNRIKPANYSLVNGYYIIQKTINGKNKVFNVFNAKEISEETVKEIVEFYRNVSWNEEYKQIVEDLFS